MRTRTLGLLLLAVSSALLLVRAPSSTGRTAEPDTRAEYMNPHDVTVDKEGKIAYVLLLGLSRYARVDLVTGEVSVAPKEAANLGLRIEFKGEGLQMSSSKCSLEDYKDELARQMVAESNGFSGACLREKHVLIAHQRPKAKIPATQVTQGWIFTNVLSMVRSDDEKGNKQSDLTAALDEPNRGYANPMHVVDAPSGYVFVACGGADMVLVIDLEAFQKHAKALKQLDRPPIQERRKNDWGGDGPVYVLDGSDDLTASRHFIKAKIPVQANPRRLGLSGDGKTLVVSNYLADSLTVIDTEKLKVVKHISLGGPAPDAARRGEILFNLGKMTFQGAFTCASCHPNGGTDGLNWDLTRDGIGNFKNTKSLLGVRDTGPYGWEGKSATLEDRVAGTLRTLHQHEPVGTEVADIVAYLKSLPPPKPKQVEEWDEKAVARGKALFQEKARCATCHQRAGYDDGKSHDVGTRGETDTTALFDTPALRGVARTAPYLHDGRAVTLEEIFTKHNPKKRHGAAHVLSDDEFKDLIMYLKSL